MVALLNNWWRLLLLLSVEHICIVSIVHQAAGAFLYAKLLSGVLNHRRDAKVAALTELFLAESQKNRCFRSTKNREAQYNRALLTEGMKIERAEVKKHGKASDRGYGLSQTRCLVQELLLCTLKRAKKHTKRVLEYFGVEDPRYRDIADAVGHHLHRTPIPQWDLHGVE